MKINNTDPNIKETWERLCEILESPKKTCFSELRNLGFEVIDNGKTHAKLYIKYNNKTHVITMSKSPSDINWGKQTLRFIRKIYDGK